MPVQLHANHIANQTGGFEPQRLNHWSIRITNPGGDNFFGSSGGTGRSAADILELSLSRFTPPKRTIEPIVIPFGNEKRKVAGSVEYEQTSLVVKDYVDAATWKLLWDWQELVHNSDTGAIGYATKYKKDGIIYLYAPDGSKERRFRCQGIWPSSLGPGEFSMDSSEVNEITVDLVVDKIIAEQLVAGSA